jgi:hypothetical protein
VKQIDFLSLFVDDFIHTVNLYNGMLRKFNVNIITYLVDVGNEGYQSGLDRVFSLSRLIRVDPVFITPYTTPDQINQQLRKPGIKLFLLSQCYARSGASSGFDHAQKHTTVSQNSRINVLMDFSCYQDMGELEGKCVYVSNGVELINLLESLHSTQIYIYSSYVEAEEFIAGGAIGKMIHKNKLNVNVRISQEYRYEYGIKR